jgi:hypothetical protein
VTGGNERWRTVARDMPVSMRFRYASGHVFDLSTELIRASPHFQLSWVYLAIFLVAWGGLGAISCMDMRAGYWFISLEQIDYTSVPKTGPHLCGPVILEPQKSSRVI